MRNKFHSDLLLPGPNKQSFLLHIPSLSALSSLTSSPPLSPPDFLPPFPPSVCLVCWHFIYLWSWHPWLTICQTAPLPNLFPLNHLKALVSVLTQLPRLQSGFFVMPTYGFDCFPSSFCFCLFILLRVDAINLVWEIRGGRRRGGGAASSPIITRQNSCAAFKRMCSDDSNCVDKVWARASQPLYGSEASLNQMSWTSHWQLGQGGQTPSLQTASNQEHKQGRKKENMTGKREVRWQMKLNQRRKTESDETKQNGMKGIL